MITEHINYRKSYLLFLIFISFQQIKAQIKNEVSLYNWFDETIGRENLSINNGTLYIDFYNTKKQDNCFLNSKIFQKGDVLYDGQPYYDLNINYDIYKDNVVFETVNDKTKTLITLISDKIDSFILDGKKFDNLKNQNKKNENFISGFYESSFSVKDFTLYIKHIKLKRDVIQDDNKVYVEFDKKNSFILKKQNTFYQIDTKSEITKLFPNFKKNINEYYELNYRTEKSNKIEFIENLLKFINNLK